MMNSLRLMSCIFLGFMVMILVGTIYFALGIQDKNEYCEEIFPSEISNGWGDTSNVKEGYIECCRYNWKDNEKIKECKIFPYGEEE